MKNRTLYWFTLIELLVVMAILWIFALWTTNIDWGSLSDKQRMIIFNNKLVSNIETARNNSLIWRWIWPSLVVPKKWKIDFSLSWSWSMTVSYDSDWTNTWTPYTSLSVIPEKFYSIKSLEYSNLDWTSTWNVSWTWIVVIEWSNLSLSNVSSQYKKLKVILSYKDHEGTFSINVVNGLIERE